MSDLTTLLEVGGPVAALGGGAAYARAKHPAAYWSTVGLPVSTVRLLSTYGSVMEACGLTVAPSRLRVLAAKAMTRREVRPVPPRRGLLRPTTTGLRIRPTRMFALRARRAGVRVIPLRNTRHTCSSLLVALKVHPKIAQRILRHSQIAMTMEVYAEASEEEVRAALGKLSDAMGGAG